MKKILEKWKNTQEKVLVKEKEGSGCRGYIYDYDEIGLAIVAFPSPREDKHNNKPTLIPWGNVEQIDLC